MARVTATEVKEIMDGATVEDTTVDAFITAANLVITDVFEYDTDTSTALKTELEKWLTAHMLAMTLEKTTQQEQVGEASVKYTGLFGRGLDSSPYGQMLKVLDVSGRLANLGKRKVTVYAIPNFD